MPTTSKRQGWRNRLAGVTLTLVRPRQDTRLVACRLGCAQAVQIPRIRPARTIVPHIPAERTSKGYFNPNDRQALIQALALA